MDSVDKRVPYRSKATTTFSFGDILFTDQRKDQLRGGDFLKIFQ